MICDNCKKAGEFNWLLYTDTAPPDLIGELTKKATEYHAECDGRCTCQHRLGKHLSTHLRG